MECGIFKHVSLHSIFLNSNEIKCLIILSYYLTYMRYCIHEKKRLTVQLPNLDEDYIVEFLKEVTDSSKKTKWENKRVNRPWEE
ncbi:unnamed protein product [Schistosoma margrebowiei]|uniref:Uncharacterized protein n=1 Tax=Schistosoma margrebowiei TaxID=48269 RepID=A0AA84ZD48_9TREM|nr:unnamed protein product [Schistosoma margrebowiei]